MAGTEDGEQAHYDHHAATNTDLHPNILKYAMNIQQELNATPHDDQSHLRAFLRTSQQKQHTTSPEKEASHGLEPILSFLASPESDIVVSASENDLSHPMSQYFISSSHNTYLTGNQLYSDSSVDGYMEVLKAGCRCVEVDVWDGRAPGDESIGEQVHGIRERLHRLGGDRGESPHRSHASNDSHKGLRDRLGLHKKHSDHKSDHKLVQESKPDTKSSETPLPWRASTDPTPEPRVLHGYTLTREVSFRQVCEAIKATAFVSSDLPVIVSLEVHCSLDQQAMMVDIMRSTWRGYLLDFTNYATGDEPQYTAYPLPSPEDLKKKILIKVKYTAPEKAVEEQEKEEATADSDSSDESDPSDQDASGKPQTKKKILDELSLLGVYTRSFHFKNFLQDEAKIPTHVFALSEGKLIDSIERHAPALMAHNRKYFMRAYPKGFRVSSSNLNPIPLWRHGVQMVALNWQRCDKSIMLNEGMFGGTKGWVLKPESYRDTSQSVLNTSYAPSKDQVKSSESAPEAPSQTTESQNPSLAPTITHESDEDIEKQLDLSIGLYAAQNLPRPHGVTDQGLRPYVKCIIHNEALTSRQRSRSRSHSRSPSPKPHHAPTGQSARDRATSLLHEYTHRRGRTSSPHHSKSERSPPTHAKSKQKGRTLTQKSASPDFGGETLAFHDVSVDEEAEYMTFLRFKIMNDVVGKDQKSGWACVRLGRLRQGWGILRIKDKHGNDTDGKLLVKVDYTIRTG